MALVPVDPKAGLIFYVFDEFKHFPCRAGIIFITGFDVFVLTVDHMDISAAIDQNRAEKIYPEGFSGFE